VAVAAGVVERVAVATGVELFEPTAVRVAVPSALTRELAVELGDGARADVDGDCTALTDGQLCDASGDSSALGVVVAHARSLGEPFGVAERDALAVCEREGGADADCVGLVNNEPEAAAVSDTDGSRETDALPDVDDDPDGEREAEAEAAAVGMVGVAVSDPPLGVSVADARLVADVAADGFGKEDTAAERVAREGDAAGEFEPVPLGDHVFEGDGAKVALAVHVFEDVLTSTVGDDDAEALADADEHALSVATDAEAEGEAEFDADVLAVADADRDAVRTADCAGERVAVAHCDGVAVSAERPDGESRADREPDAVE